MRRKYVFTEYEKEYDEYTAWNFLLDASMFLITGGIWLIWICIREARKR
jgi:hypothetical protein